MSALEQVRIVAALIYIHVENTEVDHAGWMFVAAADAMPSWTIEAWLPAVPNLNPKLFV